MDWKPYYDTELREAKTRDKIKQWLRIADEMAVASGTYDSRTVLSFPHTAVDYSGPLQARVISWLYGNGFKRVIALGVMHGSLIPAYQVAVNELSPLEEREAAYEQVCGAFLTTADQVETPFGTLDVLSVDQAVSAEIRQDHSNLLENEFSLDTFHAVMRLAADVYQVEPLPVIPLYVGMMRNPLNGSFATAEVLARWLDDCWDEETAIVTTGDVVHFGAVYGSGTMEASTQQLETEFRHRVETVLELSFQGGQAEKAFQMALHDLKSDQREILPLLAHLLGQGALAEIDTFTLSDYAAIFNTPPPCLVASALIAYKRR
jgi:predicted class III extradiol MEMO1 family dioxygenase